MIGTVAFAVATTHLQFYRNRQLNPNFMWGPTSAKQPLSMADILAVGAAAVVKQCSGLALNITYTFGRPDVTVADDSPLPSPTSVIEDRHNSIFQQMVG
jgi:hypothetical protein